MDRLRMARPARASAEGGTEERRSEVSAISDCCSSVKRWRRVVKKADGGRGLGGAIFLCWIQVTDGLRRSQLEPGFVCSGPRNHDRPRLQPCEGEAIMTLTQRPWRGILLAYRPVQACQLLLA